MEIGDKVRLKRGKYKNSIATIIDIDSSNIDSSNDVGVETPREIY